MNEHPISDELFERSKNDRKSHMIVGSEIRAAINELRADLTISQYQEVRLREALKHERRRCQLRHGLQYADCLLCDQLKVCITNAALAFPAPDLVSRSKKLHELWLTNAIVATVLNRGGDTEDCILALADALDKVTEQNITLLEHRRVVVE